MATALLVSSPQSSVSTSVAMVSSVRRSRPGVYAACCSPAAYPFPNPRARRPTPRRPAAGLRTARRPRAAAPGRRRSRSASRRPLVHRADQIPEQHRLPRPPGSAAPAALSSSGRPGSRSAPTSASSPAAWSPPKQSLIARLARRAGPRPAPRSSAFRYAGRAPGRPSAWRCSALEPQPAAIERQATRHEDARAPPDATESSRRRSEHRQVGADAASLRSCR